MIALNAETTVGFTPGGFRIKAFGNQFVKELFQLSPELAVDILIHGEPVHLLPPAGEVSQATSSAQRLW